MALLKIDCHAGFGRLPCLVSQHLGLLAVRARGLRGLGPDHLEVGAGERRGFSANMLHDTCPSN